VFCSNCGNKITTTSKLCSVCGYKTNIKKTTQKPIKNTDEDIENESSDDKNDFVDKYLKNPLIRLRLEKECSAFDLSLNDILEKVGKKYFLLADCLYSKKDYKQAISYSEKYNEINKNGLSQYLIAQSYVQLATSDKDEYVLDSFNDNMEAAFPIIESLKSENDMGKFLIFKLKGRFFSLQADYFGLMAKYNISSEFGDGKKQYRQQKTSLHNAIDSYIESLKYTTDKYKKSEVSFYIGLLYNELDNFEEALNYCLQFISIYPEPYSQYIDTDEISQIDLSIQICIICYAQLGDTENCAITLSKYLDLHEGEEIEEWLLEVKEACIEEGYDEYF